MPAQIDANKEYCVAQVNFTSAEVSHLNCSAKEMIVVLEKYPTGWWRGQVADKSGIFDSNKVTKLTTAEARKYLEDNKKQPAAAAAAPAKAAAAASPGPAAGAKESPLKMGKRAAGSGAGPAAGGTRMSFSGAAPVKTKGGAAGAGVPAKAAGAGAGAAAAAAASGGGAGTAGDEGGETWTLAADRQYVVCNADLTAHIPTHLQAAKGEVIMVVQKYQTGWYRGVTPLGASGIFDKKKVREASFAEAQAAAAAAGGGGGGGSGRPRREKPTLYRVEAMFEYTATAANQLSLVEGEVVNILQEADKGWLQAERPDTGERGFVPASYVERLPEDKKPEPAAAAAAKGAAAAAPVQQQQQQQPVVEEAAPEEEVLFTAVVEYPWDAEEEGQISLAAGQRIEVLEESEGGWWRGRNLDSHEEGFFPSSFVTPDDKSADGGGGGGAAPAAAATAPAAAAAGDGAAAPGAVMCRALFDYEGDDPETQLAFREGDLIEMLEEAEGGWARGLLRGVEGYFPLSFVEQLPPESSNSNAAAAAAAATASKAVEEAAARAVAATREMEENKKRQREEEDRKKRELEKKKEEENERLRKELERQKEVENARLKVRVHFLFIWLTLVWTGGAGTSQAGRRGAGAQEARGRGAQEAGGRGPDSAGAGRGQADPGGGRAQDARGGAAAGAGERAAATARAGGAAP